MNRIRAFARNSEWINAQNRNYRTRLDETKFVMFVTGFCYQWDEYELDNATEEEIFELNELLDQINEITGN